MKKYESNYVCHEIRKSRKVRSKSFLKQADDERFKLNVGDPTIVIVKCKGMMSTRDNGLSLSIIQLFALPQNVH